MPSFKHTFQIPDESFSYTNRSVSLEVSISKPDHRHQITFAVNLPDALYQRVKGTHTDYGIGFEQRLKADSFPALAHQFGCIVEDSLVKKTEEENYGEKMLFVRVSTESNQVRDHVFGGRLEHRNTIDFGYFSGFVKEVKSYSMMREKDIILRTIYVPWMDSPSHGGSISRGADLKEGKMVPLNEESLHGKRFDDYARHYRMIPHTPEREAYLQHITENLSAITDKLGKFFAGINTEELDQLMLDMPVARLLTA